MRGRLLECACVATVVIAVTVLFKFVPTDASQSDQTRTLTTAWDAPNLQGIWTADFETPLERPAQFADREFFTDQERTAIDDERARLLGLDRRRSPRGSEQDVGGAYDQTIFSDA